MSERLMEYFNKVPRVVTLSTADKNGIVNVACFGSPKMLDGKIVFMGLGKNRTFSNLQENPNAIFLKIEPGKTMMEWKGVKIDVKMIECQTFGEKLDRIKESVAHHGGESASKMIHAAITFEIHGIRPLVDFGQGWEKSI